jgi:8-oxo-dGTP pyrophosphatase MutT (NUDIX family)
MAHIHEKIDFTVEVFVVHKKKVLLRMHDKYNKWLAVGGHVELDEDLNQAAIREVKEEVGLDITLYGHVHKSDGESDGYKELIAPYFLNRHRINETHEHVSLTYFAVATSDVINQTVEHEQSQDCRWLNSQELEDLAGASNMIKHYARTALATLAR